MEFRFEGIQSLNEKLDEVRKKFPYEEEKILMKTGRKLRRLSIEKAQNGKDHYYYKGRRIKRKNKSHLNRNYKLSKINYEKDEINITMTNKSPHYHLVARGHKIVTKDGREIGFVPGKHMVERSMQELDTLLPEELDKWLDKLLR